MFESLEPRCLLAVTAFVDHGQLIVRGSDANDFATIVRGEDINTYHFNGSTEGEGTRAQILTFRNIRRGIRIDMAGGNDVVTLQGLRVSGNITVDGGAGDDELIVRSTRPTGDLIWRGGDGDDSVLVRKSTIQGDIFLDGGAGKDRTYFSFVHGRRRLRIQDTTGASVITFTRLSLDRDAIIATGNSLDRLTIHDSTFKSAATVGLQDGDDQLRIRGTAFRQTPSISADGGDNQIDREIILEWDFRDGAQGWEAGFSDYPAGQVVGTGPDGRDILAEEAYQLSSGVESLPQPFDAADTGFKLSGLNGSDDLFMYLTKAVGSLQGIQPHTNYLLRYTIKYVTDKRSSAQWYYLKVGAVSHEPVLRPAERGPLTLQYRINVDIGNQANSGTDASVAGFLTNDWETIRPVWASARRRHTHTSPIVSDERGQLWLLVGVDSAFENPLTFYVQSIKVVLSPVT